MRLMSNHIPGNGLFSNSKDGIRRVQGQRLFRLFE